MTERYRMFVRRPMGYSQRDLDMKEEQRKELRYEVTELRELSLKLAAKIRELSYHLHAELLPAEAPDEDDKGSD